MGEEEEGVQVGRRGRRGKGWEKRKKGYRLRGEEEGVKVGRRGRRGKGWEERKKG